MKYRFLIGLLPLFFATCKVAEKNIAGTYHPSGDARTRLILKENNTFELALLNPQSDFVVSKSGDRMNYSTSGVWNYENGTVMLRPFSAAEVTTVVSGSDVDDSITRFTNISSFNFFNRYGDPVSIRYILLPSTKPKPHYGNSLYFFAQDFKETDTLRFFFDGYPPFSYPGSVPSSMGNNMHKIVLQEPYKAGTFEELKMTVKRDKLVYGSGVQFKKSEEAN